MDTATVFSMSVALDLLKVASAKTSGLALVTSADLEAALTPRGEPTLGLPLFWPELERVLPDRGLPRGVVELAAPRGLGGPTRVALAAVRGGQAKSAGAWCAWLDPEGSLYAPGVAKSEVDLQRLLVVRPPRKDLPNVAVKLAQSRAFEVIVVDYAPLPLVEVPSARSASGTASRRGRPKQALRPEVLVRKLALLAEEGGSTIVLLTDSTAPRPIPWPVALRLELSRAPGALTVKVAKDRFCRLGTARIDWSTRALSRAPVAPSSSTSLTAAYAAAAE